ncbi:MAG: NrfD/PsrC family molybdoenzyme membrane anchor subunit [Acidobacteriaceae bacterium]
MAEIREFNDPRDIFTTLTPAYDIQRAATPGKVKESGYYGLPILKRPFWKWEIALYFFFEGISAGSYVLCTAAGLRDREHFAESIRRGRYLSFAAMLLCPPLLIADLGRPERFHHMLRIFKKTSPMNHGAWALSGYGLFSSILAALAWPARDLPFSFLRALLRGFQWIMPERLLSLLGMPFALTMISYPGVLLETTANPVWSHTNFLGPLFASSSLSNGASALALLNYKSEDHALHSALTRFEDLASGAEAASLALYVHSAGPAAKPLFKGKQSKLFLFGAIGLGLVAPALLRRSRSKVLRDGIAPLLTLLGGVALKWSITYAGQESALDAELASKNAPSKTGEPFWGPAKPATSYPPPR